METALKVVQSEVAEDFAELHNTVKRTQKSFVECGQALARLKSRWDKWTKEERGGYESWKEYLEGEHGISGRDGNRLIDAARTLNVLSEGGNCPLLPLNLGQCRKLEGIPKSDLPRVWSEVAKDAEKRRAEAAKREGVEPDEIPWGKVLSAQKIAKHKAVVAGKGDTVLKTTIKSRGGLGEIRVRSAQLAYRISRLLENQNAEMLAKEYEWTLLELNTTGKALTDCRTTVTDLLKQLKPLAMQMKGDAST